MEYNKKCEDCVLDGECLFQDNDDVENCEIEEDEIENQTHET